MKEAYDFLEAIEPGTFHDLVGYTIRMDGVVHSSLDCFCLAVPADDDERAVVILFQCSRLPILWKLAAMYADRFDTVRFRRDFKNKYDERSVPMSRILEKTRLVNHLYV